MSTKILFHQRQKKKCIWKEITDMELLEDNVLLELKIWVKLYAEMTVEHQQEEAVNTFSFSKSPHSPHYWQWVNRRQSQSVFNNTWLFQKHPYGSLQLHFEDSPLVFESQEVKHNGQFQIYFGTWLGEKVVSGFFIPICLFKSFVLFVCWKSWGR